MQATNTSTSTDLSQRTWYAPGSTTPSIVDGNFVVSHAFTYNTAGTYKVKLILRDQNYCLDSLESAPIVVSEVKPQFTMSFNPLTGCVPTTASFTDASTASPGTVQSLAWDFGDPTSGAANTSTIANPSHLYTLPGAYIIKLTAVSTAGCTLEKDTLIQTFGTPYNFTRDSIVCTNQDIQVAAQVSGSNSQYLWNFGDPASGAANTSTLATPIKTYTTEGSYMVCLDLTDPNGCTGHLCKTVTVANPHPAFIVDKPNGKCPPHNVKFTDQSTNAIKWLWDFGDGTSTSTQQNPLHSYFFPGSYAVKLKVTGAGGCSDSLTKTNYITVGGPTGSLAFSPNRGCKPLTVTFTATGNNTRDYIYDIGDVAHTTIIHNGNVTGTDVLNFIFNKDSIFHPVILLRDATGCTVGFAATDSIVVITTPAIASPKAHVAICIGDTVRLHGAGGVSYLWDNTSNTLSCTNCQNPVATPPVTMIYTVTVTGQNTCTATDTLTVKVLPFPHPTLTITPDSIICPGATIPLLVTSSTNPATYAWDVGGVGLSSYNIPNPNATPTVDSVRYNVTVTGAGQCTSVASVTLTTIHEKYEIGGPTRTICKGGSVTLKPLIGTSPVFTAVHSPQSVLSCASCDSTVASPTKTDTIAIVVTSPHYCRLKDSVLVRVVPHDSVFAGIDTFTCVGTPVRLNGFAPKDGTFFWTPTTYLTDYNTHNPYANPPAGQQFYSYAITWQKDLCKWVDTTRVELITKADITAKADTDQVCAGMPVKIRAKGRAYLCSWHPSAGLDDSHNAVATVLNPQTNLSFYVIGAISTCKTDTAYVNIAVNALPSVKAKPAQAYYFPNEIVPISVVAPTGLSYAWTPTTYLIGGANTATTSAQPTADITYTVTVTDINSCTNTANVSLRRRPECYEDQIVVPTGFTPNGDGQNDILYVLGDAVNLPSIESFRVYDRWGNAVFETNDKAHGWDGTYKGQPVSPGVFIFYVTAKCVVDGSIITKSGNVTLLR